jgi:hypothetical protein
MGDKDGRWKWLIDYRDRKEKMVTGLGDWKRLGGVGDSDGRGAGVRKR